MSTGWDKQHLAPLTVVRSFARKDFKPDHYYKIYFFGSWQNIKTRICVT